MAIVARRSVKSVKSVKSHPLIWAYVAKVSVIQAATRARAWDCGWKFTDFTYCAD
jgi:hypothetical protein